MRVVASRPVRSRLAPMDLEEVRYLAQRFPDASLRETAVVRAPELDRSADISGKTRVWLALEALQRTGSFKVRGALVALDRIHKAQGPGARVVAASAGNHGAGVAYAAFVLGLEATIVVPANVPRKKRARMEFEGVKVILAESDRYDDAEAEALALAKETGASFVSAYDDLDVLAGNGGSLGFEIVRAMGGVPDLALTPFGGGGLATGLAHAFAAESDECQTRRCVWGVQSEASAAMALSLEAGAAVERLAPSGATLAEGLEGGISKPAFQRAREAIAGVVVVSEAQIASAMAYASREMGMVLEGSASVVLAPLLGGIPEPVLASTLGEGESDLVVVLTGRNVDREKLVSIAASGEHRFGPLPRQ
jgi:threonine dehydratase